jgi:hypothetical protein
LQHQLEVADNYDWGVIIAFTSLYNYVPYFRERDREMGAGLTKLVRKFWADVEAGNEPEPDFYRDSAVINALYRNAGGEPIDKTEDEVFEVLCSKLKRLKDEEKDVKEEKEATQAMIHRILEDAGGCFTKRFSVDAGWTKGSAGTVVTEEMVGDVIGAKKGYRKCNIKDLTTTGD